LSLRSKAWMQERKWAGNDLSDHKFKIGETHYHQSLSRLAVRCTHGLNTIAVATYREAFEQVAHDWFALADQVEWLEGHRATSNEKPK
jgi:hypothetical protein